MSDEPKKLEGWSADEPDESTKIGDAPAETLALFLEQPEAEEAMTRTLSRDELLDEDAASYVPDFVPLPPPDENEETMPLGGRIDGKRLDGKDHAPVQEESTRAIPKPGDQEIQVEIESTVIIVNEGLYDKSDLVVISPDAQEPASAPATGSVRSTTAALPRIATQPLAFFPVGNLPPRPELLPPPEPKEEPVEAPKRRSRWRLWLLALFIFGACAAGGYYAWQLGYIEY